MLCSKCKESSRDSDHSWCRRCLRDEQRRRREADRPHARVIAKTHRLKSYSEKRIKLLAIKDSPCIDCHIKYPHYVMQFDHRNPKAKFRAVATMMRHTVSWKRIEAEIAKCDLVCANCHAARTWKRAHGN